MAPQFIYLFIYLLSFLLGVYFTAYVQGMNITLHSQVCLLTPLSSFQIGFLIPFFKAKKRQNVSLAYICGDFVQVHYRANFILQVL